MRFRGLSRLVRGIRLIGSQELTKQTLKSYEIGSLPLCSSPVYLFSATRRRRANEHPENTVLRVTYEQYIVRSGCMDNKIALAKKKKMAVDNVFE